MSILMLAISLYFVRLYDAIIIPIVDNKRTFEKGGYMGVGKFTSRNFPCDDNISSLEKKQKNVGKDAKNSV